MVIENHEYRFGFAPCPLGQFCRYGGVMNEPPHASWPSTGLATPELTVQGARAELAPEDQQDPVPHEYPGGGFAAIVQQKRLSERPIVRTSQPLPDPMAVQLISAAHRLKERPGRTGQMGPDFLSFLAREWSGRHQRCKKLPCAIADSAADSGTDHV
jgi:hypothetical protein